MVGMPVTSTFKRDEAYTFLMGLFVAASWAISLFLKFSHACASLNLGPLSYLILVVSWLMATAVVYGFAIAYYMLLDLWLTQTKNQDSSTIRTCLKMHGKMLYDLDVYKDTQTSCWILCLAVVAIPLSCYPLEIISIKTINYFGFVSVGSLLIVVWFAYHAFRLQRTLIQLATLKGRGELDFFDMKKYAEKQGESHAAASYPYFFMSWKRESPRVPGHYWTRDDTGILLVAVFNDAHGELSVLMPGSNSTILLPLEPSTREWYGPIATPP